MKIQLNEEDMRIFKNACELWIERLGMTDWEVTYGWTDEKDVRASCRWLYKDKMATIFLSRSWDESFDYADKYNILIKTALHEVLHLLLGEIQSSAEDRSWSEVEFERAMHSVIHRLQKLLLDREGR